MVQPIATINIALRTATVSRAGFGTPIFISSHRSFPERVRTYTNITAVGQDFDTSHPAYVAAQGFFSSSPSPSRIKIGRRESTLILTPENVANGSQHTVTITVNDGDSVTASVTASSGDTAENVSQALVSAINGDSDVSAHVTATTVGSGTSATVQVAVDSASDVFSISAVSNLSQSFTSTETATEVLQAIRDVDDDFYFVTAEDHTSIYVLAMAAAVQALEKMYFVSTQEQASITTAYSTSATDILARLRTGNFTRTVGFWSQDANTRFRECNYVGVNAPYSPDVRSVVWSLVQLAGVPVAQNSSNNQLTATQSQNLDNRNASYVRSTLAGLRVEGGQTASGEWIDNIRTLDTMAARVREGQVALFANQAGGKVPGNATGVGLAVAALRAALNPFVASTAIEPGFVIDSDNTTIDIGTRTLNGLSFTATLSGAIIRVVINGSLVSQSNTGA